MELRQLRCFVAVAEELHFGRAAARLHVAQPAVSQTIRGLEKELGIQLFDRANRRITLTAAGEVLLSESRAALARVDDLVTTMQRLRNGEGGDVCIGAVPALPPELIPELLRRISLIDCAPRTVVRAASAGRSAAELLASTAYDLVLVRGTDQTPGLETLVVAREMVGVAVASNHPLAAQESVAAEQLSGVPLVSFARNADPAEFDRIYATMAAAGLRDLRLVHESHQGAVDASLRLVEQGVGASLKLASEVRSFGSAGVVWRPVLDVDLEVVVSAAWRADRVTPSLARVISAIRQLETAPPHRHAPS